MTACKMNWSKPVKAMKCLHGKQNALLISRNAWNPEKEQPSDWFALKAWEVSNQLTCCELRTRDVLCWTQWLAIESAHIQCHGLVVILRFIYCRLDVHPVAIDQRDSQKIIDSHTYTALFADRVDCRYCVYIQKLIHGKRRCEPRLVCMHWTLIKLFLCRKDGWCKPTPSPHDKSLLLS